MADSIAFRAADLRCHCERPHPLGEGGPLHGLHLHGSLELRLEDAVSTIPPDVCVNGFTAALTQMRDHLVFGNRALDPTTYHLHAPKTWPLLEFLRMNDSVRIAVLVDGDGDSTVVSVDEFEPAIDGFLQEVFATVNALRPKDRPVEAEDFFASRCDVFRTSRAAQRAPERLQSATDPSRTPDANAPTVMCIRVADMVGAPSAGSMRGRCMGCGAPIWISRSSRVIIEEQSNPVYCTHCVSPSTA